MRLSVAIGLAASVAVGLAAVVDLARASAQVHEYNDMDDESRLASWAFHFGAMQMVAVVLGAVLIASSVFVVYRLRGRVSGWVNRVGVAATLSVIGLSALVVFGAHRGRAIYGAEDPSAWMNVCAVAPSRAK